MDRAGCHSGRSRGCGDRPTSRSTSRRRRCSGCCRSRSICSRLWRCFATGLGSRMRWSSDRAVSGGPLAISLIGGDREYWIGLHRAQSAGAVRARARCHGELYARRPAPRCSPNSICGLARRRDRRDVAGLIARMSSAGPTSTRSDHRRAAGAARRIERTVRSLLWAFPALGVAALAIVLPFVADIHLNESAAIPFFRSRWWCCSG